MLFNEADRKLPDIANIFAGFITCRLRFAMWILVSHDYLKRGTCAYTAHGALHRAVTDPV